METWREKSVQKTLKYFSKDRYAGEWSHAQTNRTHISQAIIELYKTLFLRQTLLNVDMLA
jgi:hypothetical protein